MNTIGLDACKKGWCGIGKINNGMIWGCFDNLNEMISHHHKLDRILIDIPIGLSSNNFLRTVDTKARTFLANRKSSIFSPPCREALHANNYKEALALNQKIEGKGISIQAYNIAPKIKEVDDWLSHKSNKIKVLEAHPELCFKSLNNGKDLNFSKHDKLGIYERKTILFNQNYQLEVVYDDILNNYKRSEVKRDDILDAMALFIVNEQTKVLKIIEDENNVDETGKQVGIVYG